MGTLVYGPGEYEIEIDERTLLHLRLAILAKLRRGECFSFSWQGPSDAPAARHSVWLHPAIPLRFELPGHAPRELNRAWIKALLDSANDGDLRLIEEPGRAS